jgi:hypothetical protein
VSIIMSDELAGKGGPCGILQHENKKINYSRGHMTNKNNVPMQSTEEGIAGFFMHKRLVKSTLDQWLECPKLSRK